ncbi:MAG: hypothetical protein Q8J70_05330, partial [Thiobacillus sp.]|nr:hypothetical protein [Thiobacillus sp.]
MIAATSPSAPKSGIGCRNGSGKTGNQTHGLGVKAQPGWFPKRYFLRGSITFRTGLVQQTVQIVAAHDLTLF